MLSRESPLPVCGPGAVQPLPGGLVQEHPVLVAGLRDLHRLRVVHKQDVVTLGRAEHHCMELEDIQLTNISTKASPSEGSFSPGFGTYLNENSK